MNAAAIYQEMTVTTQSQGKLIVLLYDGAISYLRKAGRYMKGQDATGKTRSINCARDIIMELNRSLNLEQGGQIARNLRSLYNFLWRYLSDANFKNDIRILNHSIKILDELGQAWKEVV